MPLPTCHTLLIETIKYFTIQTSSNPRGGETSELPQHVVHVHNDDNNNNIHVKWWCTLYYSALLSSLNEGMSMIEILCGHLEVVQDVA